MLGRGGMGTVVEAYDPTLRRTVALKLLHRDLAPTYGRRLLREARALARLSHPNVVHVHEAGELDGQAFIAMERVHGQSLLQWQSHPRPWEETVEAYRQAGRGLAAAHAAGLVHRDFKPSNCMVDEHDRVKVLDFGLVRDLHGGESGRSTQYPPGRRDSMRLAQTLTKTGAVVGTLVYMSPEQLCGRSVDARSDQFSFCAALYEALYGVRPFDGRSIGELLTAVMDGSPPSTPRGAKIPVRVRKALLCGLQRDADHRWPSMDDLLQELDRSSWPTRWIVGAATATVLAVALATWPRSPAPDAVEGCGADDRTAMADAWNDEYRTRVRRALEGHERPYGPHAWQQLAPRLDDFAREWEQQIDTTCEAMARGTSASRAADMDRLRCLEHRRWALEETVTVLAEADAVIVDHATALVLGMPSVDCHSPRSEPSSISSTPKIDHALARARALTDAGHVQSAATPLSVVLSDTDIDDPHLRPEALRLRARAHRAAGEHSRARRALLEAFALADAAGDDLAATRAIVALTSCDDDPTPTHEHWSTWVRTRLDRPDLPSHLRGPLARSMAVTLERGGEPDAAIAMLERALDAITHAHLRDPLHPDIATAHAHLARLLESQGRLDEAIDHYHHARVRQEALLGQGHPELEPTRAALARTVRARDLASAPRDAHPATPEPAGPAPTVPPSRTDPAPPPSAAARPSAAKAAPTTDPPAPSGPSTPTQSPW